MKKQLKRKYWHVTCFDGHNFHAPDGTHILTDWADCEKALDLLNAVNKSIDDARKEVANDRRRKNKAARGRKPHLDRGVKIDSPNSKRSVL